MSHIAVPSNSRGYPVTHRFPGRALVLYDNTTTREDAGADWGFSALVTFRGETILFDSGTKPDLLLAHRKVLGDDPPRIGKAVISHAHGGHLNGIFRVFPFHRQMKVSFLDAFPERAFAQASAAGMTPARVTKPVEIAPAVFSTGVVEGNPPEQSLAVETAGGLVVITGRSHPGVTRMVEAARRTPGGKPVRLLLGGFHMPRDSEDTIRRTIARLRALEVQQVAPTHCIGESAIAAFREAFGKNFRSAGVGQRFRRD